MAQSHKVRSRATQPVGAESYYGRPILKEPTWTWEVPLYLFAGGIAGGAAALAAGARLVGNDELARRATLVNLAAISASPALLASELGRPDRFLHMLRVVKPTSPMNIGTWVVSASGVASGVAGACELLGILPRVRAAGTAAAGAARTLPLDVHRRPRLDHRRARVARGPARAAVRLRRQRGSERRRGGRARRRPPGRRARRAGSRSPARRSSSRPRR